MLRVTSLHSGELRYQPPYRSCQSASWTMAFGVSTIFIIYSVITEFPRLGNQTSNNGTTKASRLVADWH